MVVYLRAIFYPEGFVFPLTDFGVGTLFKRLLLTEVGREAATIILIFSGAWLFGQNRRQRFAYFFTIFAVWDIFYYVWLKILLNWPGSIMDWDILFLIPVAWASPVLAPVLISLTMLIFAAIILYRDDCARPVKAAGLDWVGFMSAVLVVVVSFCIAGAHIEQPDFESYFYWPIFALGYVSAVAVFARCFLKSK
ncbi:MAG: hypothetical protein ACYS1A_05415 [Planctomycetota bacterium]